MSFVLPKKTYFPVFDIPGEDFYKTEFVDRRIATIAGKSILSEKNQPTKPSKEFIFRKCYAVNNDILYKYDDYNNLYSNEQLDYKASLMQESDYYIPISVFFINKKIKLNIPDHNIIKDSPNRIVNSTPLYKDILTDFNNYDNFVYHSDYLCITKTYDYSREKYLLNFQFTKNEKTKKLLLRNKSYKLNIFFDNNINLNKVKRNDSSLNKDIIFSYIYDFTNFNNKNREKMFLLNCVSKIQPKLDSKKIKNNYNLTRNDDFAYINHFILEFESLFKITKEKILSSEIFAKFYITAPVNLKPIVSFEKIKDSEVFSSEISCFISDSKTQILDYKSKVNANESYIRQDISIKKSKLDLTEIAYFDDYKKDFNSTLSNTPSLNQNKSLLINLKYRKPRLALKLSMYKPKFSFMKINYSICCNREINKKIIYKPTKILKARFNNIPFIHLSPKCFGFHLNNNSLNIAKQFKQRKSYFFNKSPKHAKYSNSKLKCLITVNSFEKSKIIKLKTETFYLKDFNNKIVRRQIINYAYECINLEKIKYLSKDIPGRITTDRINFNKIVYSRKITSINYCKTSIDNLTLRRRIGLNHVKNLKSIHTSVLNNKKVFVFSFLKPQKRIGLNRNTHPLKKSTFNILVLKNLNGVFNSEKKALDRFTIKYQFKETSFCPYLPKQICSYFDLNINIIGIKIVGNLAQKNIIPPPDWGKIGKKYDCKLRLNPFPFGFPKFFVMPPSFILLVTRDKYSIKDITIRNIFKESFFVITKDKLYLPELSMKKPRRLLYSEITPKNSPKEFYRKKLKPEILLLDQPKTLSSFDYSWKYHKSRDYISEILVSFIQNFVAKTKKTLFAIRKVAFSPFLTVNNRLPVSVPETMPQVKAFSIRNINFELETKCGKLVENGFMEKIKTTFSNSGLTFLVPEFETKEMFSPMKNVNIWTFYQHINKSYPANEVLPSYTIRFRTFHFPYVPESEITITKKLLFAKDFDYSSFNSCKFQEEFRVTQFEFGSFEIQECYCKSFGYDNYKKVQKKLEFMPNIGNLAIETSKNFVQPYDFNFKPNTFIIPKFFQHLISPKFFRIREKFSFKYMRRGKMLSTVKYRTISKLPFESFYNIDPALASSMDSPSFHWIILLRKNKSIGYRYNFLFKSAFLSKKLLSVVYKFSDFNSEKYNHYNLEKPEIRGMQRSELAYSTEFSNLTIYNNYISNLMKSRKISLIDISRVNKEKLFSLHVSIKIFDFKIQEVVTHQDKVIEPDRSLGLIQKNRLKFSAVIEKKEEIHFKNFSSNVQKRLSFHPIYITDFIDINEREKNTLDLKLVD